MEDIITRLEKTNARLSSLEETQLRSLASELDLQIQALDRERVRLVAQRKRCEGVLSPLRRFPNELLGEIFSWDVLENSSFSTALKLSQICKGWREVVRSRPDFWTNMDLPLDRDTKLVEQQESMLEIIATCIERAQGRPMSLSVDPSYQCNMPQLLDFIPQATTSVQWKSISLFSGHSEECSSIFKHMALHPGKFASLTKFEIQATFSSSDGTIPGGIDLLSLVKLRELAINIERPSNLNIDTVRIPWSQLTSLTMSWPLSSSQYLGILSKCTNLVRCCISPYDMAETTDLEDANDTEKVHLIRLKHLNLHQTSQDSPLYVLQPLVTPSLSEFIFTFDRYPEELQDTAGQLEHFSSFIKRNTASLQKLSVPGALVNLCHCPLEGLGYLKHLKITPPYRPPPYGYSMEDYSDFAYDSDTTLYALVPNHSRTKMPLLESIELVDHPFLCEESQKSLVDVIASRCQGQGKLSGPRHLRRVVLGFFDTSEREAHMGLTGRLRAFQKKGLVVEELEPLGSYVLSCD